MSFVERDERSPIDTTTTTIEISSCPYALRKLQQQQRQHFGYSTFRIHNNNANTNGHYHGEVCVVKDSKQQQQQHQKQRTINDKTIVVWPSWLSPRLFHSSPSSSRQCYYFQHASSSPINEDESSSTPPRFNCCCCNCTSWLSSNKKHNSCSHYKSGIRYCYCFQTPLILGVMLKRPWKLVFSMLVCVAVSMFHFRVHEQQQQQQHSYHYYHFPFHESNDRRNHAIYNAEPEWSWDHNIYNPQRQPAAEAAAAAAPKPVAGERNLLLAQMAGSEALQTMAEISSRPNRAYARQWGRDYVLYKGSAQSLERTCFDKVVVLSTILDKQVSLHAGEDSVWSLVQAPATTTTAAAAAASRSVQYDVVALFPPDATMTNLDSDLLNLMPPDKLLAMARWQLPAPSTTSTSSSSSSASSRTTTMTQALSSGIVLFNLRHKYASTVVKLWYSMVEPPVSCGACNDLLILLHAVQTVLEQEQEQEQHQGSSNNNNIDNDDDTTTNNDDGMSENIMNAISSVVASLDETDDGFVGGYSIKTIPISVPAPKATMLVANEAASRAELQKTADSVCYRYYPKCEVL